MMAMAQLLAAALARARVDERELRRIGSDCGRYLSARPGEQDAAAQLTKVLARVSVQSPGLRRALGMD